jgi:hypothetical protein
MVQKKAGNKPCLFSTTPILLSRALRCHLEGAERLKNPAQSAQDKLLKAINILQEQDSSLRSK